MSAASSFWANRSKKQKIVIVGVFVLLVFGVIGSLNKPKVTSATPSPSASTVSIADLRKAYLADLDKVEVDYFVADKAAFGFLKTYCQLIEDGQTPATPDAITTVVANYCGTPLAEDVGVVPAEPFPAGVDVAAFNKTSKSKWGIGEVASDGSAMNPARFAMQLCKANIDVMASNLGSDFEGSFQEYALTTFCPDKLP